eukprot:UN23603
MGKTNTPEFAGSWMTMNHKNGVARNPHDLRLSPGGSSGGSGIATTARLVPMAIAEDTGGSIRHPAHNTGIYGYDPLRNKYPNDGNSPITYFNDQLGLHGRKYNEILLLDQIITGKVEEHSNAKKLVGKLKNSDIRIGFPEEYFQRLP